MLLRAASVARQPQLPRFRSFRKQRVASVGKGCRIGLPLGVDLFPKVEATGPQRFSSKAVGGLSYQELGNVSQRDSIHGRRPEQNAA